MFILKQSKIRSSACIEHLKDFTIELYIYLFFIINCIIVHIFATNKQKIK